MTATPNKMQMSDFDGIIDISSKYSRMGDDYFVAKLNYTNGQGGDEAFKSHRINGMLVALNLKGTISLEINTDKFHLKSPSIILTGGNNLIKLIEAETKRLDSYLFYLSETFISGINIDMNALQQAHLNRRHSPVIELTRDDTALIARYMELLLETAEANPGSNLYSRSIARSLTAALVYQLMQIFDRKYTEIMAMDNNLDDHTQHQGAVRRTSYVREFIKLIHANFSRERTVTFYAERLCISPKYLSSVVKECTGRSPGEWIDEYVILEAKNLLRFSGMSVQEVAYTLNFNSQSTFGKYFKNITGMSPTQFQKS